MGMRVVRHRDGARLVDGECVLSEMRGAPGPTHCLFDVLAASIPALSAGPRVLILGFAGGGVIAPLRGAGWHHPVEAVDWVRDGETLFREMSRGWGGEVVLHESEARSWLRANPGRRFDLVLEDLSVRSADVVTKPPVSYRELPREIRSHLAPHGVVVINALPVPGRSWKALLGGLASPYRRAVVVTFEQWENRVIIAGPQLWPARKVSNRLRAVLERLGSMQRHRMSVRALELD